MTTEHLDREPLTMDELAAVIARDIPAGSFVNLGIGLPAKIADHLPAGLGVVLHTENGMLGMGPRAEGDAIDADLTNAGKVPLTGVGCVSRVYTDFGVFDLEPAGMRMRETYGATEADLRARLHLWP